MERADQLLVSSLKKEERRRGRRLLFIVLGILVAGGVTMSLILCFVFLNPGTNAQVLSPSEKNLAVQAVEKPRAAQAAQTKTVAFDNADDAGRLTAEGWSLWQKQDVNAAAAKFEQAVKLDPKNVGAWNGLGWSSFSASNFEAANKAFHKCIALEPKHPAALNGLGQVALYQRQYAEAEKYLLQAAPQASAVVVRPHQGLSADGQVRKGGQMGRENHPIGRGGSRMFSSCSRRRKNTTCPPTCER